MRNKVLQKIAVSDFSFDNIFFLRILQNRHLTAITCLLCVFSWSEISAVNQCQQYKKSHDHDAELWLWWVQVADPITYIQAISTVHSTGKLQKFSEISWIVCGLYTPADFRQNLQFTCGSFRCSTGYFYIQGYRICTLEHQKV